jgi:cytochrome c
MNLDQIIIPPDAHHVELLSVFLIVSLVLFVPFVGMVLGASFFSVIFNFLGERKLHKDYIRFSKDLMDKLTIGRNAGWGLAVVPVLSVTFVYMQLLYGASNLTVGTLVLSAITLIAGLIFIYRYKNTLELESIVDSFKSLIRTKSNLTEEDLPENVKEYEETNIKVNRKNALWGVILLSFSLFFFVSAISVASDPDKWGMTFMHLFISGDETINYFYYLALSGAVTGGAILFFFFSWQGGIQDMSENYRRFTRRFALSLALISTIVQMVLLMFTFFTLPAVSLSASVFIYSGLALLSILIASNFLYAIIKNKEIKWAAPAFFFMILVVFFTSLREQVVLGNAIKPHLQSVVYAKADEVEKEKISKTLGASDVNAEQIYAQKCSACHAFDKKLVGPAHKDVVPKYNGDVKKLADFIYNPVKVDAAYPPMPNQGLKKKEADALAQYLISKLGGK